MLTFQQMKNCKKYSLKITKLPGSILHPQIIQGYEMNESLPVNQFFFLCLIIPVKYSIKHLKRIYTILFSIHRTKNCGSKIEYDYY